MRAVIYIPEASDDVVTSYQWYERREHGLGEDFLQSIESCVTTILRHPQAFHQVEGGFRRAVAHRFPYAVFFKCPRHLRGVPVLAAPPEMESPPAQRSVNMKNIRRGCHAGAPSPTLE